MRYSSSLTLHRFPLTPHHPPITVSEVAVSFSESCSSSESWRVTTRVAGFFLRRRWRREGGKEGRKEGGKEREGRIKDVHILLNCRSCEDISKPLRLRLLYSSKPLKLFSLFLSH